MLVRPRQSQCLYVPSVTLGNYELNNMWTSFGILGMSLILTFVIIRMSIKSQNAVCNMLIRNFSLSPIDANIQLFKSPCSSIYRCAFWCNSFRYTIRKVTVNYCDTFKRLVNVPRYSRPSLAFLVNSADNIKVVFQKSANCLMSRLPTSTNSIITAIVSSDAYL